MALLSGAVAPNFSASIRISNSRPNCSVGALSAQSTCCCSAKHYSQLKLTLSCLRSRPITIVACVPSSTPQKDVFPSSSSSSAAAEPPKLKKLFVSGLSFYTTEDSMRKCFSRFGQLVEVKIIMDKFAKRSKGFGFIEYATEAEAEEAIKGMDGKFLDGRVIFVEIAKPRAPPLPRATGPPQLL